MTKEQLDETYKKMKKEEDEDGEKKEESKKAKKKVVKESLDEVFKGLSLNEDVMKKTSVLFEAAVADKVSQVEKELQESYETKLTETKEALYEEVDRYLNYVVEEFVTENQVAIEAGLKVELAENFINGMKQLFQENHVSLPEEKVDMVVALSEEVESLKKELNEKTHQLMESMEEKEKFQRAAYLIEASKELSDVQKDKLVSLVEHIEFDSFEEFKTNVGIIVEGLFSKDELNESKEDLDDVDLVQKKLNEEAEADKKQEVKKEHTAMDAYRNFSKKIKK